MIKYPLVRVVFDRKKTATRQKAALVQVEVQMNGRKKYLSTGVKVYKDQWSLAHGGVVNSMEAVELNARVAAVKKQVDGYIAERQTKGEVFDFDLFGECMRRNEDKEKKVSFIDWVAERIETRKDIRETTRKTQRKLVTVLRDFGCISGFGDLTRVNVMRFDDFLKSKGNRQTTVYSYHKFLKHYAADAVMLGLVRRNPYFGLKLDKGKSESERFLTDSELRRIEKAVMPTESIERVRDLFLMQCYTGLAYSDLMEFDWRRVDEERGRMVLRGRRRKTGMEFMVVLTEKALEILERYGYELPKISNAQYNLRLKVVADAAGIDKPIASHWGRRTCGMYLLNHGVRMEVVAKVLGHASIRTTEQVYARILPGAVIEAFEGIE